MNFIFFFIALIIFHFKSSELIWHLLQLQLSLGAVKKRIHNLIQIKIFT